LDNVKAILPPLYPASVFTPLTFYLSVLTPRDKDREKVCLFITGGLLTLATLTLYISDTLIIVILLINGWLLLSFGRLPGVLVWFKYNSGLKQCRAANCQDEFRFNPLSAETSHSRNVDLSVI
jgi:hypothetical protein